MRKVQNNLFGHKEAQKHKKELPKIPNVLGAVFSFVFLCFFVTDYFACFSSCSLINNSAKSGTTSHAISRTTLSDIISTTRRAMTSIISGVNVPALIGADGSATTGSAAATSGISDANSCVSAKEE